MLYEVVQKIFKGSAMKIQQYSQQCWHPSCYCWRSWVLDSLPLPVSLCTLNHQPIAQMVYLTDSFFWYLTILIYVYTIEYRISELENSFVLVQIGVLCAPLVFGSEAKQEKPNLKNRCA
jgi:hypothetical protein